MPVNGGLAVCSLVESFWRRLTSGGSRCRPGDWLSAATPSARGPLVAGRCSLSLSEREGVELNDTLRFNVLGLPEAVEGLPLG